METLQQLYQYINIQNYHESKSLIKEHGITSEVLELLIEAAKPDGGVLPNYIPGLEHIKHPHETVVGLRDSTGMTITHGNIKKIVSAQSTMKILLYAYALETGAKRHDIAGSEAVGLPFNDDPITHGKSHTAAHPLNNAGGISSASEIIQRDDFLTFVKTICDNNNINVLEDIYTSEKQHRQNNLKLAASLAAAGRIAYDNIESSLDHYTKASAIGVTVEDMLNIGTILMLGGKNAQGEKILQHNTVVRVINAMNSFGLYDATARMGLMHSGTRSLAAKSGVSGLVLFVNPYAGTYVTLGHHLDRQGNSVFGMQISAGLNDLLSHGGAMRLDMQGREEMMQHYQKDLMAFTKNEALKRLRNDAFCKDSFILDEIAIAEMTETLELEQKMIAEGLASCHIDGHRH